jgi:hypothetical protein
MIQKYNTIDQAKFYLEHMGIDFEDYLLEDRNYRDALDQCAQILGTFGIVFLLDREHLPEYLFGKDDIIVVLGQDGLVANTLKYLDSQKVVAINPDPKRWDGVLLPFQVHQLHSVIEDTLKNNRPVKSITMVKATLNDGQCLYGVNDLFIGQRTHVSSRYQIRFDDEVEAQSSSGIIVSTGLGSTGWLKSIFSGAAGILQHHFHLPLKESDKTAKMPWDADYLYFSVREPYPSKTTGDRIVFGRIGPTSRFSIESRMPANGCIFSDGIEEDFLEFNSGAIVTITIAQKQGKLVI